MTRPKLIGPQAEAAAKRAAIPRKPRQKKPKMVVTGEVLGPPIEQHFLGEQTLSDGGAPPVAPLQEPAPAVRLISRRVPVPGRAHLEVDAAHAEHAEIPAGAVVRLLVRRGQDGPAAKQALLARGADHVHVAPVPEDRVAELPQREALTDPLAALLEYAKRDPPPAGTDVAKLAREVFGDG